LPLVALAASSLISVSLQAQLVRILNYSGLNLGNYGGGEQTRGTWFQTGLSQVTAASLGFFDADWNGLTYSHGVGLWNDAGDLLASVTVPSGTSAPCDNWFRWVNLGTPITLNANTRYRVGGVTTGDTTLELGFFNWESDSAVQVASGFDIVGNVSGNIGAGLSFPYLLSNNNAICLCT
jgi:hypothetical protein